MATLGEKNRQLREERNLKQTDERGISISDVCMAIDNGEMFKSTTTL